MQAELVLLAVEAQSLSDAMAAVTGMTELTHAAARLRGRIDHAAAGLRELVYGIMPAPLMEQGLAAAAEDLVDRIPVPTTLEMTLADGIPRPVQATAYFVLAEALNNAVRHSRARNVAVRLRHRDGLLTLHVDDDGVGGAHASGGLGLTGLRDRIEVLGGSMWIDSPAGAGTRISAELPCAPAAVDVARAQG
ncbi:sensor histidine kinase [Microbacterium kribbense]